MSTRRTFFLSVFADIKRKGKMRLYLWVPPIALYALHFYLMSFEEAISLIPTAEYRQKAWAGISAVQAGLLGIMGQSPQDYVNANIEVRDQRIRARIRTL